MGKGNSEQVLRNGCKPLTREQVEGNSVIAMDEVEKMRTIFAAIAKLVPEGEVHDLAVMGKGIATMLHNDLDVMREEAEKAGLIGEMVPDGSKLGRQPH